MTVAIPREVLDHHTAILGKTGSGKTNTAKLLIEQVVEQGARVCVLDPIKSDWWGMTSSADGKRPGLPFHILGGPRAHVPLHAGAGKAIAEIVANGSLPLSILDMADFGPGGQMQFFVDFVPTLIKKMRGVLYLVMEEAHLFAPKERSGFGAENMAIHWAKTLATAGRSKGVRLIPVTQRVQSLHNALLGSCETLIAQRLTAPADQEPVIKWLRANTDKDTAASIASSISSLGTGTGWICSGEAKIFQRVQFARIKTFDNSATPTHDATEISVKTAPVDHDALRAIIGDAVKEAEANDPKVLKARIAELERDARRQKPSAPTEGMFTQAEVNQQIAAAIQSAQVQVGKANRESERLLGLLAHIEKAAASGVTGQPVEKPVITSPVVVAAVALKRPPPQVRQDAVERPEGLDGPQQRILNSLAFWEATGLPAPYSRVQVAFMANYSPKGSTFQTPLSTLRGKGLVDYQDGKVMFTDAGRALAISHGQPTQEEVHERVMARLDGPMRRILSPLLSAYPNAMDRDSLAAAAEYSPQGSTFQTPLSTLKGLGLISYPQKGFARAADDLFI
jgi:hypothetical protein